MSGMYGNTFLNEAFLFISKDGKSLKSDIKEICKSNRIKVGEGIFKNMLNNKNYNNKIQNQVEKEIFATFNNKNIRCTNVIAVTYTSTYNGVTTVRTENEQYFTGFYKNRVYQFTLSYTTTGAALGAFNEYELSKIDLPIDVIETAIKVTEPRFSLKFAKNKIMHELHGSGSKTSDTLTNAIYSLINGKYKDQYTIKTSILGAIVIKKIKK